MNSRGEDLYPFNATGGTIHLSDAAAGRLAAADSRYPVDGNQLSVERLRLVAGGWAHATTTLKRTYPSTTDGRPDWAEFGVDVLLAPGEVIAVEQHYTIKSALGDSMEEGVGGAEWMAPERAARERRHRTQFDRPGVPDSTESESR